MSWPHFEGLQTSLGGLPEMQRVAPDSPIGNGVVAPDFARAARGATGGDVRAFEVDMART